MSPQSSFSEQRLAATREFAHTMIVVDDEAWRSDGRRMTPRGCLRAPRRGVRHDTPDTQHDLFLIRHALDTKELVDAAMDLGLICAVTRPPKRRSVRAQV